jgi:hypothetical protein
MRLTIAAGIAALLLVDRFGNAQPPATPFAPPVKSEWVATVPGESMVIVDWVDGGSAMPAIRFQGEYLLWWIKKGPVPLPLVTSTTTNPPDFIGSRDASLVTPGTFTVFGGSNIDYNAFSGGRVGLALSLGELFDWDSSFFFLAKRHFRLTLTGDAAGNPVLFRPQINMEPPFIDTNSPTGFGFGTAAAGNPVSYPAFFSDGLLAIRSTSETWGIESNAVVHLWQDDRWRFDALAGFRYLALNESLEVHDGGTILPGSGFFFLATPVFFPGARLDTYDSFKTYNHFYGGQVGARLERQFRRLFVAAATKLALGGTVEEVKINGSTGLTAAPGAPVGTAGNPLPSQGAFFGGVLAAPGNIGKFRRSAFAVVPEIKFTVGADVTAALRLFVSYNLLYWSNVMRPGDQISLLVNQAQQPGGIGFNPANPLAGAPYPRVPLTQTDFWAQGISFGFELRY